jgi:hypothetical protein
MLQFAQALIDKLKEILDNRYLADLSQEESDNCIELVKAFKNLVILEHMIIDD